MSPLETRLRSSLYCSVSYGTRTERCQGSAARLRICASSTPLPGNFGGHHGVPPRLSYFMSRSIGRPDTLQPGDWRAPSLPGAATDEEKVPAAFSEKYVLRRFLGRGSFGTVRSVVDKNTGLEWAAKILPKKLAGKDPERILLRLREEVDILRRLQTRPETLRLHEVIEDDDTLCIITEVCYGGDLEQLLRERGYLTEAEAARVVHAAARVLEECHRSGICYGDVKPANFLLKWPFPSISDPQALPDIRVADFGCAQELGPGAIKKSAGTPLYVAPEQLMQTIGLESDMWSLGMLFYQLLCGRLPFADSHGRSPMEVMMAILSEDVKFEGPRWALISDEARSLIMRMLDRDYNTRVKPGDALVDPWLTKHCWASEKEDNVCQVFDHPPRNCTSGF